MTYLYQEYIAHFGIKGQKWGVRRYQNEDGTLTEEGKKRYLGYTRDTVSRYNKAADKTNLDIKRINEKYEGIYGKDYDYTKDDAANLVYTREIMEAFKKNYRDVLAEDLDTDPKTLEGQDWLNDVFAYNNGLDIEVASLELKVDGKQSQDSKNKRYHMYS